MSPFEGVVRAKEAVLVFGVKVTAPTVTEELPSLTTVAAFSSKLTAKVVPLVLIASTVATGAVVSALVGIREE
ncbi:hypothetical protein D3C73_1614950 [compost metagenome]